MVLSAKLRFYRYIIMDIIKKRFDGFRDDRGGQTGRDRKKLLNLFDFNIF